MANGWLRRARRLLDGLAASPEHAFLALREGVFALLEEGDPGRVHRHVANILTKLGVPSRAAAAAQAARDNLI